MNEPSTIFVGKMGGFDTVIERCGEGLVRVLQVDDANDSLDDLHGPSSQVILETSALEALLWGDAPQDSESSH